MGPSAQADAGTHRDRLTTEERERVKTHEPGVREMRKVYNVEWTRTFL